MIIECPTCHTRFRLDESRIKGRGARVKCRKCGDSIVVLKESAPPSPSLDGDGFFDLGSAVRDLAGEESGAPPPARNLIPFPAPSRPTEPATPESPSPAMEAAEPEKDEVDLAFDKFLSTGVEESFPSIGETEASIPVERADPAGHGPHPGLDLDGLTLDLGPVEKLDLPPTAELEPLFGEPPAAEPPAEFRGEGGFLISDSDTLDFLQGTHGGAGSKAPPGGDDISREISSTPVEEANSFLRKPDTSPTPHEGRASSTPEGIFIERNVVTSPPAPAPVIEIPPYREAEPARAPSGESTARRESPRPRSYAGPAVAAVLAVLLAAGGYLGLTTSGRKTLERAVPGIAALWGKPAALSAPKYDLRNVIGYYESGAASPRILVIKGQVANLSTVEKSGIQVHAALLDNTDAVLAQQAVYAGNVLSGESIRKGDRNTLSKALGNRLGESLANMNLAPGKAIPFMVVFFDAPANMDSYKLEAKDSE